ncbi:hypothetical protein PR202_ga31655 [Eleusine coracana subsp. coracana]|uniref:Uncharacterized protein n=1 Tax=Eleusine coracana subsp. coracana TaxID=191504 RepID=A0AAV5DTQ8_ELECO|nr:hypothetical protein PR202_ga31655 [Eleusine coracana subsp. coracana]
MDAQHPWRAGASRLSYKNATILVCAFNLLAVAFLLHHYFSSWPRIAGGDQLDSDCLSKKAVPSAESSRTVRGLGKGFSGRPYPRLCNAGRPRLEPGTCWLQAVKEIEQESYGEHGMTTREDPKQTAAVDLSKRLKDLRAGNDGSSQKGFP